MSAEKEIAEKVKVIERPKTGPYSMAYVSAASRMMDNLIRGGGQATSAYAILLREQEGVRTNVGVKTFVSEATKIKLRIAETTKQVFRQASIQREKQIEKQVEKQVEKQRTKQTTKQIPEPRLKKILILKPKDFTDEIDSLSKRKKRGKYVWDIKNPVPTLEQILGR